jgi:hypothetical protein
MKRLFIVLFTMAAINAQAQSAEDSVKQTINRMFQGMNQADSSMVASVFHPSAVLHTINKDGVKADGYQSFGSSINRLKKGQLDERIVFGAVHVDGSLASVWTPYRLYFDGKFIHCGANSFQLLRTAGEWKIVHLIDTRRKDCAPE